MPPSSGSCRGRPGWARRHRWRWQETRMSSARRFQLAEDPDWHVLRQSRRLRLRRIGFARANSAAGACVRTRSDRRWNSLIDQTPCRLATAETVRLGCMICSTGRAISVSRSRLGWLRAAMISGRSMGIVIGSCEGCQTTPHCCASCPVDGTITWLNVDGHRGVCVAINKLAAAGAALPTVAA